nr:zinc finger, CCHC-type [Tanacetum cinerariifolium]
MGIVKKETHWRRESAASTVTIIDDWVSNTSNEGRRHDGCIYGYATKAKELGKTLDESLLVRKLLDSTPDRTSGKPGKFTIRTWRTLEKRKAI